jgi:hypothetical protein
MLFQKLSESERVCWMGFKILYLKIDFHYGVPSQHFYVSRRLFAWRSEAVEFQRPSQDWDRMTPPQLASDFISSIPDHWVVICRAMCWNLGDPSTVSHFTTGNCSVKEVRSILLRAGETRKRLFESNTHKSVCLEDTAPNLAAKWLRGWPW